MEDRWRSINEEELPIEATWVAGRSSRRLKRENVRGFESKEDRLSMDAKGLKEGIV